MEMKGVIQSCSPRLWVPPLLEQALLNAPVYRETTGWICRRLQLKPHEILHGRAAGRMEELVGCQRGGFEESALHPSELDRFEYSTYKGLSISPFPASERHCSRTLTRC